MSILWTPWVYGPEQKSSPNPANNRIDTSASTLFAKYLGSFFKVIWKITDVGKVRGKRSVMVGEVPLPWGTPLEIISVTKKHIGNNELKLTRQSYLLISLEIPNEAYMLHSQFLIGCSLLSEEWCMLIGWYWRIMRRQVNTLTCPYCITMKIYTLYVIKALAHYNWNYKKSRYRSYTLQLFSQLQKIFQRFYIWATIFATIFFGKIVVKIFVVCEGLYYEYPRVVLLLIN